MIPRGLFSQIAIILLSVLIIVTYVKPQLERARAIEDSVTVYQQEEQKVTTVNEKLTKLKSAIAGISNDDRHSLLTYMPNKVDIIAVPRDIESIVKQNGGLLLGVRDVGEDKAPVGQLAAVDSDQPVAHDFSVSIEGSYTQLKQIFATFEKNAYPLEVRELHITEKDGGFLHAELKLRTYNRRFSVDATSTSPIK
jgi:hypothetical protein